jgi:GDPmannose 4,6-dehydratase
MPKKALIIGVSGQDGAYLSELLLGKGYEVHGTSRDHKTASFENLRRLAVWENVITHSLLLGSVEEVRRLLKAIDPDEIYNLAGQTSVSRSFERPLETFNSIAGVTINILEAMRLDNSKARFFNAGSGEMFGETPVPASEETPANPRSPYGVAKAAAFHLVKSYREAYGLFTTTGILFSHESPLRPESFVIQKIVNAAVKIANGSKEKLKLGNVDINRDWGWAPEYVDAMWRIVQHKKAEDFVIATGKVVSLKEYVEIIFNELGLDANNNIVASTELMRPCEITNSVGCANKATRELEWVAKVDIKRIASNLIRSLK